MKECPTCDGDGQVQGEVDYDNNDIPIWNLEKCPQCKGTGEVI
jgi:DnaJ-class molecular chaperone